MADNYNLSFHEILTKVNNAKDKPKKIEVLRKYDTNELRMLMKGAFDPKLEWLMPEGAPPYKVNEEIQELMKEMPLDVAISSMVFFYNLGKELLGAIPKYLEQKLKKEDMQQLETHLQKNGVGINQFMHSLKEMSETSIQLPSFHSISV